MKSKTTTLMLTLAIGVILTSMIKAERRPGFEPRVPPIPIEKAIEHLYKHLKETNKPECFIDEAAFVREGKTSYWKFGTRRTKTETGHAFFFVRIDGTVVLHSVIKDG